jgi:hypothetical protein
MANWKFSFFFLLVSLLGAALGADQQQEAPDKQQGATGQQQGAAGQQQGAASQQQPAQALQVPDIVYRAESNRGPNKILADGGITSWGGNNANLDISLVEHATRQYDRSKKNHRQGRDPWISTSEDPDIGEQPVITKPCWVFTIDTTGLKDNFFNVQAAFDQAGGKNTRPNEKEWGANTKIPLSNIKEFYHMDKDETRGEVYTWETWKQEKQKEKGNKEQSSGFSGGKGPGSGSGGGQGSGSGSAGGKKPATGPLKGKEPATGPSKGKEPAAGPSEGKKPATGPSGGKTPATGPSKGKEPATGPSGTKKPATGGSGGTSPPWRPAGGNAASDSKPSGSKPAGKKKPTGKDNGGDDTPVARDVWERRRRTTRVVPLPMPRWVSRRRNQARARGRGMNNRPVARDVWGRRRRAVYVTF